VWPQPDQAAPAFAQRAITGCELLDLGSILNQQNPRSMVSFNPRQQGWEPALVEERVAQAVVFIR
jgi:hypothetical protein